MHTVQSKVYVYILSIMKRGTVNFKVKNNLFRNKDTDLKNNV